MGMDGMGDKTPPFIPSVPGAVGMDGNGWEWMGMDENLSSNSQPSFWCPHPPAWLKNRSTQRQQNRCLWQSYCWQRGHAEHRGRHAGAL